MSLAPDWKQNTTEGLQEWLRFGGVPDPDDAALVQEEIDKRQEASG